jgi:hypothetical protein
VAGIKRTQTDDKVYDQHVYSSMACVGRWFIRGWNAGTRMVQYTWIYSFVIIVIVVIVVIMIGRAVKGYRGHGVAHLLQKTAPLSVYI